MTSNLPPILSEILEKRLIDKTYVSGGCPFTFVELFGGYVVPMLSIEPDISSFRYDYYYNTTSNCLYVKNVKWIYIAKEFSSQDQKYVYYNGRSIRKCIKPPNPKSFGDKYYYDMPQKKIYGKLMLWTQIKTD